MTDKDAGLGKWLPMLTVVIPIVAVLAVLGLLLEVSHGIQDQGEILEKRSRENNSYLRTMVCIASNSPVNRTPDYVRECYQAGERNNNITIERYGDARE